MDHSELWVNGRDGSTHSRFPGSVVNFVWQGSEFRERSIVISSSPHSVTSRGIANVSCSKLGDHFLGLSMQGRNNLAFLAGIGVRF